MVGIESSCVMHCETTERLTGGTGEQVGAGTREPWDLVLRVLDFILRAMEDH